jgi:hypothetical protein
VHTVADKTVAVASHHADLADPLAQLDRCIQHGLGGFLAADDFQQLHDVRRAKEVQAQHLFRARGNAGNRVNIQRRGVAGKDRPRLQQRIQCAKDLLLELKVLVHRFDHQVSIRQRRVIAHRRDAGQAHGRLFGADPPQLEVVRIGCGHHAHRLFEHLRVVVQPQHLNAGVGQAHDNAPTHGSRADHRGLLNADCLAHAHSS